MTNEFIVPTGFVIRDYLEEYGISQKELSRRLGMSEKHVSNVLSGKSRLTEEFAISLEKIIHDVPASYWLNYESKFREFKKREELEQNEFSEEKLKYYSKKFKFSSVFGGLNWDLKKQANEMLKLLRIDNFDIFDSVYSDLEVEFMEDGGEVEPIAIWLNLAKEEIEIQNKDLSDVKFNKEKVINSLSKLKKISMNKDYINSLNSVRKLLNRAGVYLVFQDPIENSKVRGALTTYKSRPAVFISGRFKSHDHVWFALMHEIGHLLQHYVPNDTIISLEDDLYSSNSTSIKEEEANEFARNFFIDAEDYKKFVSKNEFNKSTIIDFALDQNVLPGIVVARLQHDNYVPHSKLNYLKNR
ncbi:ImmA/IrrE family metallo-endopeptidase [Alkalibacillus haloalkaliphilus]|uniref:ImmA/IrrE family metallo-endopeptidase n=1 Tax=Alkalibacillus haloalkaliphilus TaxID=94136 RepID=UPI0002E799F9|nr:ImmA/IrrE family metallo-endopeptidase [Alkalibacillus haloalkaliphilus]